MKILAAVDMLIQRQVPGLFDGFNQLRDLGEARFFNLKTTLHYEGACYANQYSDDARLWAAQKL